MLTHAPLSRRRLLGAASALALPGAAFAAAPRALSLRNLHTGERTSVVYAANGDYIADALAELSHVLRDHRSGEVYPIEPRLLDYVHALSRTLGYSGDVHVISGYRSPKTNAMLRKQGRGVAKRSLHMRGMAMDVRFVGHELRTVRSAAVDLAQGGVGYYPKSNFLHVDIGRVRSWG